MTKTLWAVSDLHTNFAQNAQRVAQLRPQDPGDWLIVAGDVADRIPDIVDTMRGLVQRFAKVIWVPGNHELFCRSSDKVTGKAKYRALVGEMRSLGVITPEDPFPVFSGTTVCPLFTLYDYSFRPLGLTAAQAVSRAKVKLDDELAIAPYVDIPQWCAQRLDYSRTRLAEVTGPTILVNHWPLVEQPTKRLYEPDIALWCGTRETSSWPVKYHAVAAVYGHLHIPVVDEIDGVIHIEASLGYPFERERRAAAGGGGAGRPWPYPVMVER